MECALQPNFVSLGQLLFKHINLKKFFDYNQHYLRLVSI